MIGRRTTLILADAYVSAFVDQDPFNVSKEIDCERLHDFLFACEFSTELCDDISRSTDRLKLKTRIKELHEGKGLPVVSHAAPVPWMGGSRLVPSRADRQRAGQKVLSQLATAILTAEERIDPSCAGFIGDLKRSLELDGYIVSGGKLVVSDGETRDVEEEQSELMLRYTALDLSDPALVKDLLEKSEEHYRSGAWRDSIGNARHYLEHVLHEVALALSRESGAPPLVIGEKQAPAGPCRKYLSDVEFISEAERRCLAELHSLLSEEGGHPNLAEEDQARIFRRFSLSMALFLLLRLGGYRENARQRALRPS